MPCRDDSCKPLKHAPRSGEVTNRCCGGKDYGPVRDSEGPSDEDLEAFDGVTRVCPECKAEVYDEATLCHNCGHAFESKDSSGLPTWAIVTIVGIVGASAMGILLMR
jgi:hypothetical protein